jgi:hypothetical protein
MDVHNSLPEKRLPAAARGSALVLAVYLKLVERPATSECQRLKKASIDELWAAAKICCVANVVRRHLESL